MRIADAELQDLPGLLAIYNDVVATSTAIFSDQPVTLEDRTRWFHARIAQGLPVLVARDGREVLGFGSFGEFRSWPGYRFTVEHSVHVAANHRGRGLGTALVQALIERARSLGKHVMIAGIDADNLGSIRMHERLGFERAALFREVGYKFGRFLDLVCLQRRLSDAPEPGK